MAKNHQKISSFSEKKFQVAKFTTPPKKKKKKLWY
jgi:hypothetical protein